MQSRYWIQRKKRRLKSIKVLMSFIIVCSVLAGSISVASADQDIRSLLSNWFDNQRTASIEKIDEDISAEQEEQTERLKEDLKTKISDANEQLEAFTETEIEKAVSELQAYADTLISNFDVDNTTAKDKTIEELEDIVAKAKTKMDELNQDGNMENEEDETEDEFSQDNNNENVSNEPDEKEGESDT